MPRPIRDAPRSCGETPVRSRLATTTSIDHSSVATAIIVSPAPQPMPVGGAMSAWPARSVPRATIGMSPSRSPRNGTAIRATQMNIVFWMNAAVGAVAMARPLKKRTNGMLPPMIAMATRPRRLRLSRARASRPAPNARASATSRIAATPFLAVV